MRFLIDEGLHTSLAKVAHEVGYIREHVNFLGLGGQKDWELTTEQLSRNSLVVRPIELGTARESLLQMFNCGLKSPHIVQEAR